MKIFIQLIAILLLAINTISAQFNSYSTLNQGFKVIPLGVKGGLDESNLSAYLVAANGSDQFICLDAGTIYKGLEMAIDKKLFNESNPSIIQQKKINSYFISHAHLDHTAGLIMNSPNDAPKKIYGLPSVLQVFKNNYFTWSAWANFGNEGEAPVLKKYTYSPLVAKQEFEVEGTGLFVTPFILSHVKPYESTAFLVKNKEHYLLYLGDTGADSIEQSTQLMELWQAMTPLIKNGQLKGIFIEVSFDNSVPAKSLFGHLNPSLLMDELGKLDRLTNGSLHKTAIYITHLKPCTNCEINIQAQIKEANHLGLNIYYPSQAAVIDLY
jgi:cAMP phosphodiesterase